jgi:Na+/proline symporter
VVGRILTALVGLVALAIAVLVLHFRWNMFDTMVLAFGFFLPPTVLPVIAGLLDKRLSAQGAVAGFLTGVGFGIAFLLYRGIAHPSNANTIQAASIVLSSAMTALALILAIAFFPAKGEAAERSHRFFEKLSQPLSPAENLESPGMIAGLVIGVMGLALVILGLGVAFAIPNKLTLGVGLALLIISIALRLGSRRPTMPRP